MNIDFKLIGKRIQKERKKAKITQEELAERIDVSVGYVSQIERGFTKVNLNMLSQICTELNCDIAYIITGTAVNHSSYLNEEITNKISSLSNIQKQMVLDFIELLKRNM